MMTRAVQGREAEKFTSMAREVSKWMDHVLGRPYHKYVPGESWTPAINVYEARTHYCVVVDLAGVGADQIDLNIDESTITISGERTSPGPPKSCGQVQMHLMEIDHGRFCRTMELPENVDVDGIEASYRTGFLWMRLPKRPL